MSDQPPPKWDAATRARQGETTGVVRWVLGISLTLAEVSGDTFAVWLIPHTVASTNVRERGEGDAVNLEFDLLGKYVEKLLGRNSAS